MKHANGKILFCLLGLLGLFVSPQLKAQIEKGAHLFGTNVDGNFESFSGASNVNVSLGAEFQYAYFIRDGLAFGAQMPIGYNGSTIFNPNVRTVQVGLGPWLQWYPGEQKGMVKWYTFVESSLQVGQFNGFILDQNFTINQFNWTDWVNGAGVGINAFLSPNVALNGSLTGLYSLRIRNGLNPESTALTFDFGVQVFLPSRL